jgi:hypothetical protein
LHFALITPTNVTGARTGPVQDQFGDSIAQPHQQTILFSIVGNHANVMIVGTDPGQSRAVISRKPIE